MKPLFHQSTYIQGEENIKKGDKGKACFGVKVWSTDLGLIAKSGLLKVEEPRVHSPPPYHFPELGIEDEANSERIGPISTLDYEVLIHLDEVLDFPPASDSPEYQSLDSETSGTGRELVYKGITCSNWTCHSQKRKLQK